MLNTKTKTTFWKNILIFLISLSLFSGLFCNLAFAIPGDPGNIPSLPADPSAMPFWTPSTTTPAATSDPGAAGTVSPELLNSMVGPVTTDPVGSVNGGSTPISSSAAPIVSPPPPNTDVPAQSTPIGETLAWLVGSILKIPFDLSAIALTWSGKLLNWVFGLETFKNIAAVDAIWALLRDICNMFFIVILMLSAIATILRIDKYGVGKVLPRLVFVIFAVNFSKTIIYVIVDFTQVLSRTFFQIVGAGSQISEQLGNSMGLSAVFKAPYFWSQEAFKGAGGMIVVNLLLATVVQVIAAITISVGAILLLERIVYIWIAIASAPLVWGLSAIPSMDGYLKSWNSDLSKKAFFAPIYAAYLAFALLLINGGQYMTSSASITPGNGLTEFFRNPICIITYIVSIVVLWKALSYAKKSSTIAASYAAKKGQDLVGWGRDRATMKRTRDAVMTEHKRRKEMKEEMKKETAQELSQQIYRLKDAVQKNTTVLAGTKIRGIARDTNLPGLKSINEKGYTARVLEKRKEAEISKTRSDKTKEYKDDPPKDLFAEYDKAKNKGEKQALALHLADNADEFNKDSAEAYKQLVKMAEAFGEDKKAREDFIKKVKKSRLDLVIEFNIKNDPANKKVKEEEFKNMIAKKIHETVKGLSADQVVQQSDATWKNQEFVDAIAENKNLAEGVSKKGISEERASAIKESESAKKARETTTEDYKKWIT